MVRLRYLLSNLLLVLVALCCIPESSAALPQPGSLSAMATDNGSSLAVRSPRGGALFGRHKTNDPMAKIPPPPGVYSAGRILEFHKGTWMPVALGVMYVTETCTTRAALMAGLFGGYGLLWILKSYTFWDKGFYNDSKAQGGVGFIAFMVGTVSMYYLFPYIAVKNSEPIHVCETTLATLLFVIGCFLHYAADAQKFFTLKYRGRGLITEGLFSRVRHPNYLGEYLMWLGMTVVAGYDKPLAWLPVAWFGMICTSVLIPDKEKSLSRYPEYQEWSKRSGAILPKLF